MPRSAAARAYTDTILARAHAAVAESSVAPARHAPGRAAPAPRPHVPLPRNPSRKPHQPARKRQAPPRGAAVLDALLRGRTWIALVFVLLAGIVFLNVTLLRINREIAASAAKSRAVKLENAQLRTNIARLGSSERIQRVAAQRGLVLPAPGEVRYLKSSPRVDARKAADRLKNAGSTSQPAVAPQAGLQTQTTPPQQASPPNAVPQAPTQAQPNAQPPASTQAPVAAQPQAPAQPSG